MSYPMRNNNGGRVKAKPEMQKSIRILVADRGLAEAALEIGLSRLSVACVAAGFDVQPGTVAMVERWLERRREL